MPSNRFASLLLYQAYNSAPYWSKEQTEESQALT
jgi:hypothetical protein